LVEWPNMLNRQVKMSEEAKETGENGFQPKNGFLGGFLGGKTDFWANRGWKLDFLANYGW